MGPIKFPTTVAEFIAFQEAGIHRELDEVERDLAALAMELFNLSYSAGLRGRRCAGTTVDECIAQGAFSPPETIECRQFMEAVVHWCDLAFRQGYEDGIYEKEVAYGTLNGNV